MYPFWDRVVWPILQAAEARRIVEIGALRGDTTALMLERLGPDTELHVIDPVPEFDPGLHEARFPGRYIFHRDISHNVLPGLPAVDVALVDGDHNWFTVYNELKLLAASARRDGAPLPILIMHDVLWPYGRRDLYYAPERIPEEFRQPYALRGIKPGVSEALPQGGLNPEHYNAIVEGGPRNGVMTALDDFVAGHDRPVRRVVLPVYFGLAIVVEEARLANEPDVAALLDWLESADGKDVLLDIGETMRLQAMLFQHNDYYGHRDRLRRIGRQYLDLLEAALLNELYLDHELRLSYLVDCLKQGNDPSRSRLGDPVREMQNRWEPLVERRRAGMVPGADPTGSKLPYAEIGRVRMDALRRHLDIVRDERVGGDIVECGGGRGGPAIFMRGYLDAFEIESKQVWVADEFRVAENPEDDLDVWTDLNTTRDGFARFGLLDDRVHFLSGNPPAALTDAPIKRIALMRVGQCDIADGVKALEAMYPRIAMGGVVVVDDAMSQARNDAIEQFLERMGIDETIERDDGSAVWWRKTKPAHRPRAASTQPRASHAPLAPPVPSEAKDLSVVVVFYNMRREAARTLHSLSRSYQRGVEDLDYEVIVIDNGSSPDQLLGDEYVRSFGPEFTYVELGEQATPTPVDALNHGVRLASGRALAFMIDGAHVLTPGVLRYGMAGLRTYEPAVSVVQQWYVGPGQQPDAMLNGYDQPFEDDLFRHIEWPLDGYRLFDIGHFIGERDWFDGLWESNCIFVPRKLLEQYGVFDERFAMPGGGYANLEFYERVGGAPEVNVVTLLGEGSFHQVHGGTTTNAVDPDDRRATIAGYAKHFEELRGRPFRGSQKTLHYVGTMFQRAARTRARRMTADAFVKGRVNTGPDGFPTTPTPIPDELKLSFTDAFWQSLAWRDTTWLGQRVKNAPTDLVVYQEIVHRVRPDWIIETGTQNGGRALFFASLCELIGHGRVLSLDPQLPAKRVEHPRITYLDAVPQTKETAEQVREIVGPDARALVVLGSQPATNMRMELQFARLSPFVPVGSYVIMENTMFNGRPVWPGHGPGPWEAVRRILAMHPEFAIDPTMERYGLTFNPEGFLKRIR
jgi:cephalosporin hydroxylase